MKGGSENIEGDTMTDIEAPCEDTGKGCRWIWCCELCGNMFCLDCYKSRDWDLKKYGDEEG